jgi:hypothetical protein
MTLAGWIFMSLSVAGVLALVMWCFRRILTAGSEGDRD